jgi:hypothetical protein
LELLGSRLELLAGQLKRLNAEQENQQRLMADIAETLDRIDDRLLRLEAARLDEDRLVAESCSMH